MKRELLKSMTANEKAAFIHKWARCFRALKPSVQKEIRDYLQNNPKLAESVGIQLNK